MSRRPSLLDGVQGLLERTYGMRTGIDDLAHFIIGDRGLRQLYGSARGSTVVGAADGSGARLLLRDHALAPRICLYFPDAMIERLEAYPPQHGLGEENVDAFATFVEEIDHLLLVAERSRQERCVSLFELELHANVSKYLVLTRFLAGGRPVLSAAERLWLRHELFGKVRYVDPDPSVRDRYRDARRFAVRLLDGLGPLGTALRLELLRRFHDAPAPHKIELIDRLAA